MGGLWSIGRVSLALCLAGMVGAASACGDDGGAASTTVDAPPDAAPPQDESIDPVQGADSGQPPTPDMDSGVPSGGGQADAGEQDPGLFDGSVDNPCGNGTVEGLEECDDGNREDGDGCGQSCASEPGYTCDGSPSQCATSCGDGVRAASEACDDGDADAGDGCDESCQVEGGWACSGEVGATSSCLNTCGNGTLDDGEICDLGEGATAPGCIDCQVTDGYACEGAPSRCAEVCGDGNQVGAEVCDDGNTADGDYCAADCRSATGECGDGQVQNNEACDDGNGLDDDYCSNDCQTEGRCGDGVLQGNEDCDVAVTGCGNVTDCRADPGFSCTRDVAPTCQQTCGNGTLDEGEECDNGSDAGCTSSCRPEPGYTCTGDVGDPSQCTTVCGDGIEAGDEQCDDGNDVDDDYCTNGCADNGRCGDSVPQTGAEQCDDGNDVNNDYCTNNCRSNGLCGDGIQQAGVEDCDDGNDVDDDYCTNNCQSNGFCGDGVTQAGAEECDDENLEANDYCDNQCASNGRCGDGLLQVGEQCDDAEQIPDVGDGCDATCQVEDGFTCDNDPLPSQCERGCGASWLVTYELGVPDNVNFPNSYFRLRDMPVNQPDLDQAVGPGRMTIRFEDVDGNPGGRAVIESYELDYVFATSFSGLGTNATITTDVDTVGVVQAGACGLGAGSLTGSTLNWDGPMRNVDSEGSVVNDCSGFLCGTIDNSIPNGGVIDSVGPQGLRPFLFNPTGDGFETPNSIRLGANHGECYLELDETVSCPLGPNDDPGDPDRGDDDGNNDDESPKIWVQYEGRELTRQLQAQTPDCFCE